jgi:hypothetical protein
MTEQAYIVVLEVENHETAEVEREYAVCLSVPEILHTSQGTQGPSGPPGPSLTEEETVYAKRVDMVGDSLIYRGEAAVGSAESAPVWRIRRITLTGDDMTEEWAGGNAAFDKAWADRAALGYS